MKGETNLCAIIESAKVYMQKHNYPISEICEIYMHAIEHIYYKVTNYSNDVNVIIIIAYIIVILMHSLMYIHWMHKH